MTLPLDRRAFLAGAFSLPLASGAVGEATPQPARPRRESRIKLSCNLYSFNGPLTSGAMTLEQVIDYCAELGFQGIHCIAQAVGCFHHYLGPRQAHLFRLLC